jgi:hypothetical protein
MKKEKYILTTEHAASSYGQPVLVNTETNEAYGIGDILPDSIPAAMKYEELRQQDD